MMSAERSDYLASDREPGGVRVWSGPLGHLCPGDEDGDVGDLDRGRGLDASLRAQRRAAIPAQARVAEELLDLGFAEAEPQVGVLGAHPLVGMF